MTVHECHVPCDEKKPHPCHEDGCPERVDAAYPALPPAESAEDERLNKAVKAAYDPDTGAQAVQS